MEGDISTAIVKALKNAPFGMEREALVRLVVSDQDVTYVAVEVTLDYLLRQHKVVQNGTIVTLKTK